MDDTTHVIMNFLKSPWIAPHLSLQVGSFQNILEPTFMITLEMSFMLVVVILIIIRNHDPMFANNVQIKFFLTSIVVVLHVPNLEPL